MRTLAELGDDAEQVLIEAPLKQEVRLHARHQEVGPAEGAMDTQKQHVCIPCSEFVQHAVDAEFSHASSMEKTSTPSSCCSRAHA